MFDWAVMLQWLTAVVSIIALAVSVLAYFQSRKAARHARKSALFGTRLEAISHVRNAMYDVTIDGNITAKTVASIREAFQISLLVFDSTITAKLDQAHRIAFQLQHKPFDQRTDRDDKDRDLLAGHLKNVLKAMNEETQFTR